MADAARDATANGLWGSLGIGVLTGMRSMSALAALAWAASLGRTRIGWIPSGPEARGLATAAALAEMVGDKMPFAPDRRIVPSFLVRLVRLVLGAVGRAARGGTTRSAGDWARALTEDVLAASLAAALVRSVAQPGRA
jgi:uncharacterized membrane protein